MSEHDGTDAQPCRVVGIGASAGGLEALREMLSPAQAPTGMAFVIVQHLDPNHESLLAQLLARHTSLQVLQAEGGERIAPDIVYIIPPGHGLAIRSGVLELTDFAQPRGHRRPIDDFFLSLAVDQQANAACVILSGTGADGTIGLRAVKENGGVCVVQQPGSARYDGMPASAVKTGLVDFVKAPDEIVGCLMAFFDRSADNTPRQPGPRVTDHLDEICRALRMGVGHDFSGYKQSTLVRRIERRMQVLGIASAHHYAERVKQDGAERHALFRDLLINVTRFFRDAEPFDVLRRQVIEPLVEQRQGGGEIRTWIAGCSSGEEAYSVAMLFAAALDGLSDPPQVQIFATDIDEQMLQIAREANYPVSALADIPLALRERYVVAHADRFTIAPQIRDMVRFSNHSLVKDPPFSRLDLITCRNVLIYFDDELQQSVAPLMHYALQPGGFLFLGPSESIGRFEQLFVPVEQSARLFRRSPARATYPIGLPRTTDPRSISAGAPAAPPHLPRTVDERSATARLVDAYAPPSLVLDGDGRIVAAYGKLGRYFDFPVTRTSGASVIALARPRLRHALSRLLREGAAPRRRQVIRNVMVRVDRGEQLLDVIADPLHDGTLLLVLRESGPFRPIDDDDIEELEGDDDHLGLLEEELLTTRHRLRTAIEELETTNEELKSSNEEMMSMNEELQSTNEELITVNDELKNKVDQITVANADLRNFFESTDLASIVLDWRLHIRSYTEAAKSLFPLQPSDIGRPLAEVASALATHDYLDDARAVAGGGAPVRRRVFTRTTGRTYLLRAEPYRTAGGAIEGATLVFADMTDEFQLERDLADERSRLDLAIRAGRIGVWEYTPEGKLTLDAMGRELFALPAPGPHALGDVLESVAKADQVDLRATVRGAIARGEDVEATFRLATTEPEPRWLKIYGKMMGSGATRRMIGVAIDVTVERLAAITKELMLREMNHRVKNLFAVIGGMISAGARSYDEVGPFARDMRDRIAALGRAHSLALPSAEEQRIELGELVDSVLAPYRNLAGLTLSGPPLHVRYACLSPVALILHEWASNSVKYGALGSGGQLEVTWQHAADATRLVWLEHAETPEPDEPRAGFGTQLVEASLRQLRARLNRDSGGGRFRLELLLPPEVFADE